VAELRDSGDRGRPPCGHGIAVLLKIYAHCIDGRADAASKRITDALSFPRRSRTPGDEGDADSDPAA
jgi:hypothetical protein